MKVTLADEVQELQRVIATNPRVSTSPGGGLTTLLTLQTDPFALDHFKASNTLSYYPQIQNRRRLGMETEWYDIRLKDFRIFLEGVKLKNDATLDDEQKIVNVDVTLGGVFTVQDDHFRSYDFQVPERQLTYSYNYSQAPKYETKSSVELTEFVFELSNGNRDEVHKMTLASPFTRWHISVSDRFDLTQLTAVKIQMDIRFRTNAKPKPLGFPVAEVDSVDETEDPAVSPEVDVRPLPKSGVPSKNFRGRDHLIVHATLSAPSVPKRPGSARVAHIDSAAGMGNDIFRLSGKFLDSVRPFRANFAPLTNVVFSNRPNYAALNRFTARINPRFKYQMMDFPKASVLSDFGSTPREQAKGVIEALAKGGEHLAKVHSANHRMIEDALGAFPAAGSGLNRLSYAKVTTEGHEAFMMTRLPTMNDGGSKRLQDLNHGPGTFLASFPYARVSIIPRDLSASLEAAKDKREWLDSNQSRIEEHTAEILESGGDFKNLYVVLGDLAVIKVMDVAITKMDTATVMTFGAATTDDHSLDGFNRWSLVRKTSTGEMYAANHLIGKHVLVGADILNVVFGEAAMGLTASTIQAVLEAQKLGISLTECLERNPKYGDLLNARRLVTVADVYFSTPLSRARKQMGTKTAVNITPVTEAVGLALADVANAKFPETKEPSGLFYDGNPVLLASHMTLTDCSTVGDSLLNPLNEKQRQVAADTVIEISRYNLSRQTIEDLKDRVLKIVDAHLPTPDDAGSIKIESTASIYERIATSPSFNDLVRAELRSLVDEDTLATIKDQLSSHPEFGSLRTVDFTGDFADCVSYIANDHIIRHVLFELSKPGGLVATWTQQRIDAFMAPNLTSFDVDKAVHEATDTFEKRRMLVEQLEKTTQSLPEHDPHVAEVQRELRREKEALEEAKEAMDGAKDLKDLQTNAQERESRRQDDEQRERERAFEKPERKGKE